MPENEECEDARRGGTSAPAYRWISILWVVAFLLGMIGDSDLYPFYLIVAVLHISIADQLDGS